MASGLTDEELRRALSDLGEDVGPITPTTRGPWERKLNTLRPLNALSSDDSEAELGSNPRRRVRTRASAEPQFKKPAPVYVPGAPRHRTSVGKKGHRKSRNSSFDVETSDSDFDAIAESPKSRGLLRKPREVAALTPPTSTPHNEGLFRRRFDSDQGLHSRFSPSYDRLRREPLGFATTSAAPPCNGFLSNGGGVMGLAAAESAKGRGHCVPRLLLLGAGLFFLALGALYVSEVRKSSNIAARNYSKFCKGVNEEHCKPFLYLSQELHQLLTNHAGLYECGVTKSRNLSVTEARAAMKKVMEGNPSFKIEHFDIIFNHSVSLFKNNEAWGIRCHEGSGSEGALEAAQAAKSVWCRVRLSLAWTLTKLVLFAGVCVVLFISYLGAVFWKKRREAQEKLFYEMVEKVIDILQETNEESTCKAVVNVRDALIPAQERKSKLWLWERVVSFIEENESRVSVEFQTINGEDFKVWRWNPSSANTENENGKQGKVWQGQAFGSLGKSKNTYTPTPCLKIRNMFDPEEYGDEWQTSVRDAILEKCEGNNGIRHIAFDTSNNEGCVYMMCSSEEAAGKAYNDLHGWWFDGKLVTVKYLKKGRYLQRFSEAEHCTEPLRPSNDKRLSLAAPYFSSALERS